MEKLPNDEITKRLDRMNIWGVEDLKLKTRVEFSDFKEACFFANTVFSLAEKQGHHPEVKVEYGAVEIDLWTHEAEGLTDKDFRLAEEIEEALDLMEWD